jgi:hypothetical protein
MIHKTHITASASVQELKIWSLVAPRIRAAQPVKKAVGMNTVGSGECNVTGMPSDLTQKLIRACRATGPTKSNATLVGLVKKYTIIPAITNSNQVSHMSFLDSSTVNLLLLITFSFLI